MQAAESIWWEAAMFEDSTFESTGRIRTRSRAWMVAAFAFNTTIVLALVLIPLLYPQALPRLAINILMAVPAVPTQQPKPIVKLVNAVLVRSEANLGQFTAPRQIPNTVFIADRPEVFQPINAASMDGNGIEGNGPVFASDAHRPTVRQEQKGPVRVSGMVVEGMLLRKTVPMYPAIAYAAGVEGTVVLAAVIARDGSIQNLHVVSGSAMLQQAALDAVRTWRYRPYLLNDEPVEVETTINVIFRLH
jgi:protein TonB